MKFSIFIIVMLFSSISYSINTPSFNCQKASTHVEKSICASSTLSKLDSKLAKEYKSFFSQLSPESKITAKRMQRLWLKSRNRTCKGEDAIDCLTIQYNEWLKFMAKGVLVVKIPLNNKLLPLISPFDNNLKFHLEAVSDKNDDIRRLYRLISNDGDAEVILHEGIMFDEDINNHGKDVVSHIFFYLSRKGVKNIAFYNVNENFGSGRCTNYKSHKLNFRNVDDIRKTLKNISISGEFYECGKEYDESLGLQVNDEGNLIFLERKINDFYYSSGFSEIKAVEFNQNRIKEYFWIDKSKDNFMGVSYMEIIKNIRNKSGGLNKIMKTKYCEIPGNGLHDYWRLKAALRYEKIGFNQALYFSYNILKPEYLEFAVQYKSLLKAALMYLHKAREIHDWEKKLVKGTAKYPQVTYTSNYHYEGEADWEVNPFIQAGFYTDMSCYANARSIFKYASAEEWFYMFWARRVSDGNLEKTENLLKLLIKMMEEYKP